MKAEFYKVLSMLVFLSCFSVKAQDRLGDCHQKASPPWLFDYDERLETILHENLAKDFLVRCVYMPAFDPEWVVQLEKDPNFGAFQLCVLSFRKNLWYQKDGEVSAEKIAVPIEEKPASDMIRLVNLFIENKSNGLLMGGIEDGESIRFEVNVDGDVKCGATECPIGSTYQGRLVAFFEILKESVVNGTIDCDVFALAENLFDEASGYYSSLKSSHSKSTFLHPMDGYEDNSDMEIVFLMGVNGVMFGWNGCKHYYYPPW